MKTDTKKVADVLRAGHSSIAPAPAPTPARAARIATIRRGLGVTCPKALETASDDALTRMESALVPQAPDLAKALRAAAKRS